MKFVRTLRLAAVAGLLSVGLIGLTGPAAHADSSWGCLGCHSRGPQIP